MTDDVYRAQNTLRRGAEAFSQWPRALRQRPQITHDLRSKVIGNGLRELDRFLNLLVDAAVRERSEWVTPKQWNTANKLRGFRQESADTRDEYRRVVALGRSRNSLFHCSGIARHHDRDDPLLMTLGWTGGPGSPLTRVSLGVPIVLSASDFECIGQFYGALAQSVVSEI